MEDEQQELAARFEKERPRLRAIAYRMLGSVAEAEDAVQETWLRLARTGSEELRDVDAWLTTVIARVCLNVLRARGIRREEPLEDERRPVPVVGPPQEDPEGEALLADGVGLALLVVLETLAPAERLAFVLHDVFGTPFEEIAPLVDRSPAAARQLASRARRRVRAAAPEPDGALPARREVVEAFFAAARTGDFDGLVAVLHPDVVLRKDVGEPLLGAETVAGSALSFADPARVLRPASINGAPGVVSFIDGRPTALMAFTVVGGRVAAIDAVIDPARLARLDLGALGPEA